MSDAVDVRFQRTLGVLTPETLTGLRSLHVVIAGVGGAGGQAAVDLARMGFGYFTLADFDTYEHTNMNRQVGCFEDTLGQPKVEVVAGLCRRIHPDNQVRTFPRGVTPENAAALLAADATFPPPFMVYELMDLQGLAAKVALHAACRRAGLPCMTALAVGFGAALHVYAPDAPAYDALYLVDGRLQFPRLVPRLGSYGVTDYIERLYRGEGHSPSCAIGVTCASALLVSETLRAVREGPEALVCWPQYVYMDLYDHEYHIGTIPAPTATNPK